jgi:hypothetical protein
MNALTANDAFAREQSRHDNAVPPGYYDPEPSEDHINEAFSRLLGDDSLVQLFYDERQPDWMHAFKLFNDAGGLPLRNGSFIDDRDFDRMTNTMQGVIDDFRTWLEGLSSRPLSEMAHKVMQEEIDENKADAAEYAADCARESRDW